MDNFMSKLSQKINAQDSIKANFMADMAEKEHMKKQIQEYDAILYYNKAIKIDDNCKEAHLALSQIYFKRNDLKMAEPHFKALMRISPKDPSNYCNLINLYINDCFFEQNVL